jgi:hypothetical protein
MIEKIENLITELKQKNPIANKRIIKELEELIKIIKL